MTGDCGLLPFGVTEVGVQCIDDELFGWVQYTRKFDERYVALPGARADAQEMMAARLLRDHGFTVSKAVETARRLFAKAFEDAAAQGLRGDSLCEDVVDATRARHA